MLTSPLRLPKTARREYSAEKTASIWSNVDGKVPPEFIDSYPRPAQDQVAAAEGAKRSGGGAGAEGEAEAAAAALGSLRIGGGGGGASAAGGGGGGGGAAVAPLAVTVVDRLRLQSVDLRAQLLHQALVE